MKEIEKLYNEINTPQELLEFMDNNINYGFHGIDDKDYNFIDNIALKESINKLKDKEKKVLIDRYINGKTQIELSEELNISQAQVSRIEKNALTNIKKMTS